jgi:hypothetical protein
VTSLTQSLMVAGISLAIRFLLQLVYTTQGQFGSSSCPLQPGIHGSLKDDVVVFLLLVDGPVIVTSSEGDGNQACFLWL